MSNSSSQVSFFLELAKAQNHIGRRFDCGLGGLSLNWFVILHALNAAEDQRMRRIDLAEKVGLTPSGVTRLLAPMEKIGLIKREAADQDARVSYVALAPGGKRTYEEGLERAEVLAEDILSATGIKDTQKFTEALTKLCRLRF
jgi:DNA-binding MarR family transcriptional regulator